MPTSIIPQKAALYIRVSTDEQARHGYSLAEQKHDLEQYAERKKYAVVGVYADEGVSARKLYKHRPALMRLLDDVQAGKINIIIFKYLDRWREHLTTIIFYASSAAALSIADRTKALKVLPCFLAAC